MQQDDPRRARVEADEPDNVDNSDAKLNSASTRTQMHIYYFLEV